MDGIAFNAEGAENAEGAVVYGGPQGRRNHVSPTQPPPGRAYSTGQDGIAASISAVRRIVRRMASVIFRYVSMSS